MSKRFFILDDSDSVDYVVVATDLDHARNILIQSGAEFGDPSGSLIDIEARGDAAWHEIQPDVAVTKNVMLDDGRRVQLTECSLGDWFCSEY